MGFVSTNLKIKNPAKPRRVFEGKFLVDTGAKYTVLPEQAWKRLGLKPERTLEFSLADGTTIERAVGNAFVEFHGVTAATPVVLGEKEDSPLFGVITLEALGLSINPFTRELYPAKLMM